MWKGTGERWRDSEMPGGQTERERLKDSSTGHGGAPGVNESEALVTSPSEPHTPRHTEGEG